MKEQTTLGSRGGEQPTRLRVVFLRPQKGNNNMLKDSLVGSPNANLWLLRPINKYKQQCGTVDNLFFFSLILKTIQINFFSFLGSAEEI